MAFRLPRLDRTSVLTDKFGKATQTFQQWWQSVVTKIEAQESSQDALIAAIAAAQAAADAADAAAAAANDAATDANTAATAAQGTADSIAAEQALINSYPIGATLTATDAGSNATISIAAHTRYYGDGTSVSVSAGSVTALSYSTAYFIYYDDASRAGGGVTYQATTSASTAVQSGDRHVVGAVTTPAAAGGPVTGDTVAPPGIGDIYAF